MVFSGDGDDTYIINENQLLVDLNSSSGPAKLFDSGSGYNTLDMSSVDSSVSLMIDFSFNGTNNDLTIEATNSTGTTFTTHSTGFSNIIITSGTVNYHFDSSHINEVSYGNAPNATATGKHISFTAVDIAKLSTFNLNSTSNETFSITLDGVNRKLSVYTGSNKKTLDLLGFNTVRVMGNNVLNLTTNAETAMTFIGGNTMNDKVDFSSSSVGKVMLTFTNVNWNGTSLSSSMTYTSTANSAGIGLQNIEYIQLASAADAEVVIVERNDSAVSSSVITVVGGVGRDNTISFDSFNQAVTGTNADGYNFINFNNYVLTRHDDNFLIPENESRSIDGNEGEDTITLDNFTSGVTMLEQNGVFTINKLSSGTAYTDTLSNFEIFNLTDHDDSFERLSNSLGPKKLVSHVEINFGLGNDSANFANFVDSNIQSSSSTIKFTDATTSDINLDFLDTNNANYQSYHLISVEQVNLISNSSVNIVDDLDGVTQGLSINALSSINNIVNYNSSLSSNVAIFTSVNSGQTTLTTSSGLAIDLYNFDNYGNIDTSNLIQFVGFFDFATDYTFMNQYSDSAIKSVISYQNLTAGVLNFDISNNGLKVTSSIGAGTHTTFAHNVITSAQGDKITISEVYLGNQTLNIYSGGNFGQKDVDLSITHGLTAVINDTLLNAYTLSDITGNDSDISKGNIAGVSLSYLNAGAAASGVVNFIGTDNFILQAGNNIVNYDLNESSTTSSYDATAGSNDQFIIKTPLDMMDITIDLVGDRLTYASGKALSIIGFEEFRQEGVSGNMKLIVDNTIDDNISVFATSANIEDSVVFNSTVIVELVSSNTIVQVSFDNGKMLNLNNFDKFRFSTGDDNVKLHGDYFTKFTTMSDVQLFDGNAGSDTLDLLLGAAHSINSMNINLLAGLAYLVGKETHSFADMSTDDYVVSLADFENLSLHGGTQGDGADYDVYVNYSASYIGSLNHFVVAPMSNRIVNFNIYQNNMDGSIDWDSLFTIGTTFSLDINSDSATITLNGQELVLDGFNSFNLGTQSDIVNYTFDSYTTSSNQKEGIDTFWINRDHNGRVGGESFLLYKVNTSTSLGSVAAIQLNINGVQSVLNTMTNNAALKPSGSQLNLYGFNNFDFSNTSVSSSLLTSGVGSIVAGGPIAIGNLIQGLVVNYQGYHYLNNVTNAEVTSVNILGSQTESNSFFVNTANYNGGAEITVSGNNIKIEGVNISGTNYDISLNNFDFIALQHQFDTSVNASSNILQSVGNDVVTNIVNRHVLKITEANLTKDLWVVAPKSHVGEVLRESDFSSVPIKQLTDFRNSLDVLDMSQASNGSQLVFHIKDSIPGDSVNGMSYVTHSGHNVYVQDFEYFIGGDNGNRFDITALTENAPSSMYFVAGGSTSSAILVENYLTINLATQTIDPNFNVVKINGVYKVIFENISTLQVAGAKAINVESSYTFKRILFDSADQSEAYNINFVHDNQVIDTQGGHDTINLSKGISYEIHFGNLSTDYVTVTDQYYLILTDSSGNTSYMINIEDDVVYHNGTSVSIKDHINSITNDSSSNTKIVDNNVNNTDTSSNVSDVDSDILLNTSELAMNNNIDDTNNEVDSSLISDVSENIVNNITDIDNDLIQDNDVDLSMLVNQNNNTDTDVNNNITDELSNMLESEDTLDGLLNTASINEESSNTDVDIVDNSMLSEISMNNMELSESEITDTYKLPDEDNSESVNDIDKSISKIISNA